MGVGYNKLFDKNACPFCFNTLAKNMYVNKVKLLNFHSNSLVFWEITPCVQETATTKNNNRNNNKKNNNNYKNSNKQQNQQAKTKNQPQNIQISRFSKLQIFLNEQLKVKKYTQRLILINS